MNFEATMHDLLRRASQSLRRGRTATKTPSTNGRKIEDNIRVAKEKGDRATAAAEMGRGDKTTDCADFTESEEKGKYLLPRALTGPVACSELS